MKKPRKRFTQKRRQARKTRKRKRTAKKSSSAKNKPRKSKKGAPKRASKKRANQKKKKARSNHGKTPKPQKQKRRKKRQPKRLPAALAIPDVAVGVLAFATPQKTWTSILAAARIAGLSQVELTNKSARERAREVQQRWDQRGLLGAITTSLQKIAGGAVLDFAARGSLQEPRSRVREWIMKEQVPDGVHLYEDAIRRKMVRRAGYFIVRADGPYHGNKGWSGSNSVVVRATKRHVKVCGFRHEPPQGYDLRPSNVRLPKQITWRDLAQHLESHSNNSVIARHADLCWPEASALGDFTFLNWVASTRYENYSPVAWATQVQQRVRDLSAWVPTPTTTLPVSHRQGSGGPYLLEIVLRGNNFLSLFYQNPQCYFGPRLYNARGN